MHKPLRRITTHDVAARAGVSQATVSLVLGNNPTARVSAKTRQRVQRAAEELGYLPNLLARGLVQRRSYAIGVVLPELGNPFFVEVATGVERVAMEEGYAVLLSDARDLDLPRHIEALAARQVDGLILDAAGAAALPAELLRGHNVVLIDEPSGRWPGVASDALAAGRMAAEHLLALGHRRLAFAGPASDVHAFRMRERGFVEALRQAGVEIPSAWLRRVPARVSGGQAAMQALLALPSRPTAVFCANDMVALGALKAALTAGVRVPQDVSLVGCDDVELARIVTPELTTVAVPAREIGARAARLLIQAMAGGEPSPGRPAKLLPVRLVRRGSTGPASTTEPQ